MINSDIARINKKLKRTYGTGFAENGLNLMGAGSRPLWRIVWSKDEYEKRLGTFRDFIPGTDVLLREVTEVREVPKYSYIKPRWILEKLMYAPTPELPDSDKPHYEVIYVFENLQGTAMFPIWDYTKYLIDTIMLGAEEAARRNKYMNPDKLEAMMNEEDNKKQEKIYDELLQESSPLAAALGDGEAVSFAGLEKPATT